MKCDDVRLVLSAYLDGEISEVDREKVRLHLTGCPDCAQFLDELAEYSGLLGELADLAPSPSLEIGLRGRIRRRAALWAVFTLLGIIGVVPLWSMLAPVLNPALPFWARVGFTISTLCLASGLGLLLAHLLRDVRSLVIYGYLAGGRR